MNPTASVFTMVNNLSGILSLALVVIFGIAAVIILSRELRLRRSFDERTQQFEEMRYNDKKMWDEEHQRNISEYSSEISTEVAKQLKNDVSWASFALDKAKVKPSSQTLFAERSDHFRKEKLFIANEFLPPLIKRLRNLSENYPAVYLLIDSGTTLFPFFEKIGSVMVESFVTKENWIEKIKIITNNLPGVDSFMQHARIYHNFRYSPLAVQCNLLPGEALPVYSAVTGEDTTTFLDTFCKQNEGNYLLTLTTGNWVRIRRTEPKCPVPLARGKGHLELKQKLIDISHEIYVVSPLGKIFVDADPEDVNEDLKFGKKETVEYEAYKEVDIKTPKAKNVSLISTYRKEGRILRNLSTRLMGKINLQLPSSNACFDDTDFNDMIKHTLFLFDDLPDLEQRHKEEEIEFPHRHTRKRHFMRKYFFVDC